MRLQHCQEHIMKKKNPTILIAPHPPRECLKGNSACGHTGGAKASRAGSSCSLGFFVSLQWCCDHALALKELLLSYPVSLRQQSCLDSSNSQGDAESNYRPCLGGGAVHPRPSFLFLFPFFLSLPANKVSRAFSFSSVSALCSSLSDSCCLIITRTALQPQTISVYISRTTCRWVKLLSTTLVCTIWAPCTAAGSNRFPFTVQWTASVASHKCNSSKFIAYSSTYVLFFRACVFGLSTVLLTAICFCFCK